MSTFYLIHIAERISPKIQVFVDDVEVERVLITKIYIWNAGRETIKGENIPPRDPITFCIPEGDGRILHAEIERQAAHGNNFRLEQLEEGSVWRCCKISFDYIDYNEGAIIQIIHTSASVQKTLEGSVIGYGKMVAKDTKYVLREIERRSRSIIVGAAILALLLIPIAYAIGPSYIMRGLIIMSYLALAVGVLSTWSWQRNRQAGRFLEK